MGQLLTQYWPIITSAILLIAWLVRGEANTRANAKAHDVLAVRVSKLEDQHAIIEQMALDIREIKTNMEWLLKERRI